MATGAGSSGGTVCGEQTAQIPLNVAGSELVRSRVRVNPSEQQQEGQGRGRKEREKRGGSKRVAKGASSGLPGWARLENTGGEGRERRKRGRKRGGGRRKGWSWRELKNAALDPEILGQPPRRRTTIPAVRGPTTT